MVLAKAGDRHQWNRILRYARLRQYFHVVCHLPFYANKSISGFQIIKKEIGIALAEFGFQFHGNSCLFRFTHTDLLQFLHFQKGVRSLNEKCTINVVQQGLFVPGCSFSVLEPGGRIGNFTEENRDKWWYCNSPEAAFSSLPEIKTILFNGVLPFFQLASVESKFPELIECDRHQFIWKNSTFLHEGYFYLKCKQYDKAMNAFQVKPSRVNKFKTIKKYVENGEFERIDKQLQENVHYARSLLKS